MKLSCNGQWMTVANCLGNFLMFLPFTSTRLQLWNMTSMFSSLCCLPILYLSLCSYCLETLSLKYANENSAFILRFHYYMAVLASMLVLISSFCSSLFRSNDQSAAWIKFEKLKEILPVIIDVAREVSWFQDSIKHICKIYLKFIIGESFILFQTCQLATMQKICDSLETNPGWNVAHVVAYLDLYQVVSNEKISK